MSINKELIKQFLKEKGYLEIIFSPKGRNEIWDPRPPYGTPVQPFEELPHDNFVKITCYQGGIGWMSGSYKSFIEEIKESNTDFLTELFKWATKKENVKKIDTEQEVADAGNEIAGSIKEVIIVKKTQQDYKNDKQAYAKRADQMIANRKCFYCNGYIKPEAKDCLQHLKNCSLCPEAIKDFAKDKMIELGLKNDNSHREREREREQNRRNRNNLPNQFRRGGCKKCGRVGTLLLDLNSGLCFECFLDQVLSETKEDIKKDAEATRTAWKEDKPRFKRLIQEAKREDPVLGKKLEKAFQEIENLLYSEQKKGNSSDSGGSGWIWVLVIVIVAGVGVIVGYFLYRKRKQRNG